MSFNRFHFFRFPIDIQLKWNLIDLSKVDQNGIVYDPKTDRKCGKNGAFTTLYSVNTVRFRSVIDRIIWHRNTHRIVSVS
jgi:hypothetical protein